MAEHLRSNERSDILLRSFERNTTASTAAQRALGYAGGRRHSCWQDRLENALSKIQDGNADEQPKLGCSVRKHAKQALFSVQTRTMESRSSFFFRHVQTQLADQSAIDDITQDDSQWLALRCPRNGEP